jgi:uncharacterized membrane protein YkvA (DUF1232 family)
MKKGFIDGLKERAGLIKREISVLYFALRHTGTPWYAKAVGILTVGYALSPIDLIPDFIPVLGLLDDLIILPGMIVLTLRLIPKQVIDECRAKAESAPMMKKNYIAVIMIVAIWVFLAYLSCRIIIEINGSMRR